MRINCINVGDLTDQHLRAEWLEFLMIGPYIRRSIKSKEGLKLTDSQFYVLGTGHARFFYDKLTYVEKRYKQLETEMKNRGFVPKPQLKLDDLPKQLFNDWVPTKTDHIINLNRIIVRIADKPQWYKIHNTTLEDWQGFYEKKYEFQYDYHPDHYGSK